MLKLGTQEVSALYLGETKISRAYLGEKLVFEGSKPSRLPEGYTEVEYIQSDSACGIATGTSVMGITTKIILDIEALSWTTGGEYLLSAAASSPYYFSVKRTSSTKIDFRMGNSNSGANGSAQVDITGKRQTIQTYDGQAIIGDAKIILTGPFKYTYKNLLLFHSSGRSLQAKLYSCQIYQDGGLDREFVPCIDSGGEVGLYDLVYGTFYPNINTGTFTAGPPV